MSLKSRLGYIIFFFFLTVFCSTVTAQNIPMDVVLGPQPQKIKSVETEVKDAALFLKEKVSEYDRPYIRFFTNYAVPDNLKDDCWLQLSFVTHSLIGISLDETYGNAGGYYPIGIRVNKGTKDAPQYEIVVNNRITDTLVWIDIRHFNWTPQSWENVSEEDGYFIKPIVPEDVDGYIRLLAGNAVVRADWFIDHSMNTLKQKDTGSKQRLYRELVYSLNVQPKTVNDFEKIWGLPNLEKSRQLGNEYLTLTSNEGQVVARHNRILAGYRTEVGWLFRSYDVLSETGDRDYITSFFKWKGKPPTVFDAGELITSNPVHMQIYDLIDDKGNIIEDANAAAARHIKDVIGDVRVRVANSCADCHAGGAIPSENSIREFVKMRLDGFQIVNEKENKPEGGINTYDYADKLRIERAYLSNKFEDFVDDVQLMFTRSLLKVNGLTPDENIVSYNKMIKWYNQPLDFNQVVVETGIPQNVILDKIGGKDLVMHQRRKVPPRLSFLVVNNKKIPREVWEYRGRDGIPGTFAQTMIMVNGLTEKREIITEEVEKYGEVLIIKEQDNTIQIMGNWTTAKIGDKYEFIKEIKKDDKVIWYQVRDENGDYGYVSPIVSELIPE